MAFLQQLKMKPLSLVVIAFLCYSCSGLEQSEQDKIKKMQAQSELILRFEKETPHQIIFPQRRIRERYSWEANLAHGFTRITKEAFRCKGRGSPKPKISKESAALFDCQGADKHSLPLAEEKETIYPALLEILNYLQDNLSKKVVVTSGHRCYAHQVYLLGTTSGAVTKYLIGAQVDFIVEGVAAFDPKILEALKSYYDTTFSGDKEYTLEKSVMGVWQNKEILVKIFSKYEGRNEDNHHELPYISIELKHDRDSDTKIQVSYQKALTSYYRF